jgi:hypothetical protein
MNHKKFLDMWSRYDLDDLDNQNPYTTVEGNEIDWAQLMEGFLKEDYPQYMQSKHSKVDVPKPSERKSKGRTITIIEE